MLSRLQSSLEASSFTCLASARALVSHHARNFSIKFNADEGELGSQHQHPHPQAKDELTPGISVTEYDQRRSNLASSMGVNEIAVLPAAAQQFVAGIIPYPYRQDADFSYLTGVKQQGVCIIQSTGPEGDPGYRYHLFVPNYDPSKEQWDGATLSPRAAVEKFHAHQAHSLSELSSIFDKLARTASRVYYDPERNPTAPLHRDVSGLRSAMQDGKARSLRPYLHQLRWKKSAAEVQLMRRSAQLAADAMKACMTNSLPGVIESQLAALFEFKCKVGGAQRNSYPSVVASGTDAITIHYSRNDKRLRSGDMILMDAGCELYGYASDVTRTWPVSGTYSSEQRDLYEVVLGVHQACLAMCVPGTSLREIHTHSVEMLSDGLRHLGMVSSKSAMDIMRAGLYRTFYPHTLGHFLGMDVHDCAFVGQEPKLQPGVVLTVEPGLYIPDMDRFGHFKGLGVRIEDDVLVTEGKPEVLSIDVPVQVREIEALISRGRASSASAKEGGLNYFS